MSEFFLDDGLRGLFNITPKSVLESLTTSQVIQILRALGADNIVEQEEELIIPTICHNPLGSSKSHKLYYYFDNRTFVCYTGCQHSFNIYQLVQKVYEINDHKINFHEAFNYVLSFLDGKNQILEPTREPINQRYLRRLTATQLPAYNDRVVNSFKKIAPIEWLSEGISKEAMDKYNIRMSIAKFKIIIPHYDINGRLVGVRGRALDEYEVANYGKYMPVRIEGTFYTHHLSRNLYGVDIAKDAIRNAKRAILFEGEKSVLKMWDYYGDDSVALAVCGSNLHKVQVDILTKELGVSEIILAFDKEYSMLRTEEAENYKYKLINLCKRYENYANFSFIYDMENLLKEKDSPVDRGKEIFERLYDLRVKIR